jgi:hypothetical protein
VRACITLQRLQRLARALHDGARFFFGLDALGERLTGFGELLLERGAIGGRLLAIITQPLPERLAFDALLLGARAACLGAALPLFGHGELALEAQRALALFAGETRHFRAVGLGRGACAVRLLARPFGRADRFFGARQLRAQLLEAAGQRIEFFAPLGHLARGERDVHGEATRLVSSACRSARRRCRESERT